MAGSPTQLLNSDALETITTLSLKQFVVGAKKVLGLDKKPTIRSAVLLDRFTAAFGDELYATALCSQLVAIETIRRIETSSTEDTLKRVLQSMPHNGIEDEQLNWFEDANEYFVRLLQTSSVRYVAKALHLSTDFSEILISSNLVTDIRPVFDDEREDIVGGVVTQNLRLHYISGDGTSGEQELSLALDLDDIEKLIQRLEGAKRKSAAAKKYLKKSLDENIFVLGEDRYGFN